MPIGVASLGFWNLLPAVQTNITLALLETLDVVLGLRVDGLPAREVGQDVVYGNDARAPAVHETWQLGGLAYGVNLGLRLLIR